MSGIPLFNFPAFDAARDDWLAAGYEVFSPADHDRETYGLDPNDHPEGDASKLDISYPDLLRGAITGVLSCEAMAVLPGWRESTGAVLETTVAKTLEMPLYEAKLVDGKPVLVHETVLQESQRIVSGARQKDYGSPAVNLGRTASLWNGWLGAKGVPFTMAAEDVADFMVLLKLARLMQTNDHRDSHVDGAGWFAVRARVCGVDD